MLLRAGFRILRPGLRILRTRLRGCEIGLCGCEIGLRAATQRQPGSKPQTLAPLFKRSKPIARNFLIYVVWAARFHTLRAGFHTLRARLRALRVRFRIFGGVTPQFSHFAH